jgi:hypothetical protein
VLFAFDGSGKAVVVPQRDYRARGGFAQISFPLSRIFHADPAGRNAGWTLAFTYGLDDVLARDLLFANPKGARDKSDMAVGTLMYKMNSFVTFGLETSMYRTRSICTDANKVVGSPDDMGCTSTLYRGFAARSMHDFRTEFGPVFTF